VRRHVEVLAIAALLSAFPVSAAAAEGAAGPSRSRASWLMSGATVGAGHNALQAQLGWPGLDFTFLHGASPTLDLGASLGFNYGFEGIPKYRAMPGLRLNGVVRLELVEEDKLNIGVRVSPGFFVYFDEVYNYWHRTEIEARFGFSLPVELVAGFLVLPNLTVHAGIAMPIGFQLTESFVFLMPMLPGFGAEYRVNDALSLTFDSRFGPNIVIGEDNADVDFAFRMLVGAGYRF
jgi:hypothetical protein